LFVLFLRKNKRQEGLDRAADYGMTARAAYTLLAYYLLDFLFQVVMDDGGDQGDMGTWATHHLGFSKQLSDLLHCIISVVLLAMLVVLIVLACSEPTITSSSEDNKLLEGQQELV
jgi:hypothetical protein